MSFVLLALLAAGPVDLTVPPALLAKTSPVELSGLTWVPALSRYLVVSDDAGPPGAHAPWLFTLDAQGVFDADPMRIEGLDALDDAESITAGPDGTFFVTTSHSLNKKGKAKPARRQLLWLGLSERTLTVKGRLDLTTLITGRDDTLDVEALAFRDGALFVGCKAPLDAQGRASIFRLERVTDVFAGAPPTLRTWATPKLEVGEHVPQGVTDLLFLPDGRLLLAANAPKTGTPDGGGALWRLDGPDAKPVLVQRFTDGLKPEGLALSPDGKRVVVVFDRGAETPRWLSLPRP